MSPEAELQGVLELLGAHPRFHVARTRRVPLLGQSVESFSRIVKALLAFRSCAEFDGALTLLSCHVRLEGRAAMVVDLLWYVQKPLHGCSVFVHVLDKRGEIRLQGDHPLVCGYGGRSHLIKSQTRIEIPEGMLPQLCRVRLGVWAPQLNRHLPLTKLHRGVRDVSTPYPDAIIIGLPNERYSAMTPELASPAALVNQTRDLYLSLLKQSLLRLLAPDRYRPAAAGDIDGWEAAFTTWLRERNLALVKDSFNRSDRIEGRDWPAEAETMIGLRRLNNLQECAEDVLRHNVPGDFMEAGVWRGGASIFLRGVLQAFGDTQRTVWVADSFAGLPRPDSRRYPQDKDSLLWNSGELAVPIETVRGNFERYGLLDHRVVFLPGWFRDTLPSAPVTHLSLLRLDGDLYESTIIALRSLYPKVSVGGYVIIDDYGALPCCREAVDDFRREFEIQEPLLPIDWTGAYWRVARAIPPIEDPLSVPGYRETLWHERTIDPTYEPALHILLQTYEGRADLKETFPEAANWDFRRLIYWANGAASGAFPDGSAADLEPFRDWFGANSVDPGEIGTPPWGIIKATAEKSANFLPHTLDLISSPGFSDIGEHLPLLSMLVSEFQLGQIVEIGTRSGNSTVALLEAARAIGGNVLSIDVEPCEPARERVQSLGLETNWRFLQQNALDVDEQDIPQPVDLLFIDTIHLYTQTLAELRKFLPYVRPDGWVALHDSISFPGVSRAICDIVESLGRRPRFYPFVHQNGLSLLRL